MSFHCCERRNATRSISDPLEFSERIIWPVPTRPLDFISPGTIAPREPIRRSAEIKYVSLEFGSAGRRGGVPRSVLLGWVLFGRVSSGRRIRAVLFRGEFTVWGVKFGVSSLEVQSRRLLYAGFYPLQVTDSEKSRARTPRIWMKKTLFDTTQIEPVKLQNVGFFSETFWANEQLSRIT